MTQIDTINYDLLQDWPFKLGAAFRLVAKELLDSGWSLELFESNPERRWAYFLAKKDGKTELIASLKGELFTNLNARNGYLVTVNKGRTYTYTQHFEVPVPNTRYVTKGELVNLEDYKDWDGIVVKPLHGKSGQGITVGITDQNHLKSAVEIARKIDDTIAIQEFVKGSDHRLLFFDYKLFAAVRRDPAHVVGDGKSNVHQLIEAKNNLPKDEDYQGTTSPIKPGEVARLFGRGFLEVVPKIGEKVLVSDKANLSLGGDAYDVTETVHEAYEALLAPMIKSLGLRICGVDVLTEDISVDPKASHAKVTELNAAPNLRPHTYPTEGENRQPARKIVAMLAQAA